jgi:hypothetical protein
MASLLDALIQTESNGNPSARGPMTQYGQALGSTQMLPGTAREMAQKLGLPFRMDLLTSPTEEAKAYQRQLGEAYLQEGFAKTGNTRDALRYYHGGPDRAKWGPKTNAYADKVMSLSGDSQPMMPPQNIPPILSGAMPDAPLGIAGLMNSSPMSLDAMGLSQPNVQAQGPNIKPKAFDKGGKGWVIAGIIADALAGGFGGKGGFAPTYLAGQEDDRRLAAWREEQAQARQDRMDTSDLTLQRQIALEQYKRDNPEPASPTNAAKMLMERGIMPGTPQFQQEMGRYMNRPIMIGGQAFGYEDAAPPQGGKSVVRTGTDADGRRVVQYNDGSVDYAD